MILGIVSDTHGHVENTRQAVRLLESLEVDEVIHCGDIGSTEIPPLFAAWRTHFVFGNVDYDEYDLRQSIERAGLICHDRFGTFELAGRKIAVLHSDDERLFRAVTTSGKYDLVCYGHTHVARAEHLGITLVLNPGALYRARQHTLTVLDLTTMTPTQITV